MIETLKYLTQIKPARNYRNIDSLNNVASYLENRFKDIGLETSFQNFLVDINEYKNVIGCLNPQYEKRLVIGAHYKKAIKDIFKTQNVFSYLIYLHPTEVFISEV